MESMTGYAFDEGSCSQFSFSIEIKTLNSKYSEIYTNVPRILRTEENEVLQQLKDSFSRGKIECTIDIFDWKSEREVSINESMLKKYYEVLASFTQSLDKEKATFSLDALLSLDGVITKGRSTVSDTSLKKIFSTLKKTIKQVQKMRKDEGKSIEKDINSSLMLIQNNIKVIAEKSKFDSQKQYEKLESRIGKLLSTDIDTSRIYTEVALLADKLDLNEEVSRLKDHILKFKKTMKDNGNIGKKIDFICQEMFREINTIGSKTNSSEISHMVVEMKNAIDKIREQGRNVV